jgi:basic membrane lipoprotein Med (substrate-binding protein (PBP1-ABC) superfamily)
MHHPISRSARTLLTAAPFLLAVSLQVSADSETAGGFEPSVYHGPSLDRSMVALNETMQDQYAKERVLARLVDPVADQERFETVAAAGNTSSATDRSADVSEFGPVVFDGESLESSMVTLNENLILRGDDLFVTIANNVSDTGPSVSKKDFDFVAAILDGVLKAEAMRESEQRPGTAFGALIRDDATLDSNIALLNDEMQRREDRQIMLAGNHTPAVTGTSFEVVAYAMVVGFQ